MLKHQSHFVMPIEDWTKSYYNPLQESLNKMKLKYMGNETAEQVINMLQKEIDLYHKYCNEYSYVFYIMSK